jgi:folate-dependent phosphoribosylglycinamide formyltransferase PurN
MLNVAVLCGRRAPGLAYLLRDALRGQRYELVAGLTTDPDSDALPALAAAGVPGIVHDIRAFYAARGARRSDMTVRRAFDAETRDRLAPLHAGLIVLTGYLHLITAPLLAAFPGRIINVHDADLHERDATGAPRFPGLHATRDAIHAGARTTRCSVHVVTHEVDSGPVLFRSEAFPVHGRHHYLQREWMMRDAWGPLLARAIAAFARLPADVPAEVA